MTPDDLADRIDRVHELIRRFAADLTAEVPMEVAAHRLWGDEWDFHMAVVKSRVIAERAAEAADSWKGRDAYSIDFAWKAEQAQWLAVDRDDPNETATGPDAVAAVAALIASSSPPAQVADASGSTTGSNSRPPADMTSPGRPDEPVTHEQSRFASEAERMRDLFLQYVADLAAGVPLDVAGRRAWEGELAFNDAAESSRKVAVRAARDSASKRAHTTFDVQLSWDDDELLWAAESRAVPFTTFGVTAADAAWRLLTQAMSYQADPPAVGNTHRLDADLTPPQRDPDCQDDRGQRLYAPRRTWSRDWLRAIDGLIEYLQEDDLVAMQHQLQDLFESFHHAQHDTSDRQESPS